MKLPVHVTNKNTGVSRFAFGFVGVVYTLSALLLFVYGVVFCADGWDIGRSIACSIIVLFIGNGYLHITNTDQVLSEYNADMEVELVE